MSSYASNAQTIGFTHQRVNLELNSAAVINFFPKTGGKMPVGITPKNKYPVRYSTRDYTVHGRKSDVSVDEQIFVQSGRRFNITSKTSPIFLKSSLPSDRY